VKRRREDIVVDNMDITEIPRKQAKGKKKSSKMPKKDSASEQDHVVETRAQDPALQEPMLPHEPMLPPMFSLSEIKNKQRRHEMFMKLKQEKRKVKKTKRMN